MLKKYTGSQDKFIPVYTLSTGLSINADVTTRIAPLTCSVSLSVVLRQTHAGVCLWTYVLVGLVTSGRAITISGIDEGAPALALCATSIWLASRTSYHYGIAESAMLGYCCCHIIHIAHQCRTLVCEWCLIVQIGSAFTQSRACARVAGSITHTTFIYINLVESDWTTLKTCLCHSFVHWMGTWTKPLHEHCKPDGKISTWGRW